MKVAKITTTTRKFFHFWIEITKHGHNLGKTDGSVLAELLYYQYELRKKVKDERLVSKLLLSDDIRDKIMSSLGYKLTTYRAILARLRKKKILKKTGIDSIYEPGLKEGEDTFILAYKFKLVNNGITEETSKEISKNSG